MGHYVRFVNFFFYSAHLFFTATSTLALLLSRFVSLAKPACIAAADSAYLLLFSTGAEL
jgi:hypothetical protein